MAQAQSVAIPQRLPLVIEPGNRGGSTAFDSRLVNGYMESRKGTGGTETWIYERPGMDEDSRPPAGNATGRGVFNWRGDFYSVFGDKLYKNGVAVAGTVDTTGGVYRFDSCLGATPKLQLGNGVKGYNYDTAGGLVLINDGDFPASFVKGWAYLNGTTYVMTPSAHILGSDINDPTAWNPLNDILVQIEPDQGKALAKQLTYVVAFKEWTTEIFYDAGNAVGSPLGRVEGAKAEWGCLSADSVRDVDGTLIWLGASRNGPPEVITMDRLRAEPVSTKPVERLLEGADLTTVYSWTLKIDGHKFYLLTLKEENLTLAYDLDERAWAQWTDKDGNYLPIVSSSMDGGLHHILQHESNGRLYKASSTYSTDDGDLITVDIITPSFDGGTRRMKQLNMLEIICDREAEATLLARCNDHDFASDRWTDYRPISLSTNPRLGNCGSFSRRVYHFRYKSPLRMPRIQAVDMQIDIGVG